MATSPTFESLEDEVRFLRGLVAVQRLADEVLEDCVERQLGLAAAADVFLSQCARLIHARGGFVQVLGSQGVVLTRTVGPERVDVSRFARAVGARPIDQTRTVFVAPLNLGTTPLGSLGFVLPGRFDDGGAQVQALVETVAEAFDSAVLSFLAVADGRGVHEHLDELAAATDFRPQGRFGKYELVHPLGTGGMAQVMVARTMGPGGVSRLVALKRILPRLAADTAVVEQFLDEAKLGMRLSHPNLLTVYDFGQASSTYFIAMELVRGVDFDRVVGWEHGPLSERLVSGVVCQALLGLHAAHEARDDDGLPMGLVHRDLSPHNLMLGFDGRVKVVDFGVAKMRNQRTVTLPGIVKGKPVYMSPEQATAERVDRQSDLFTVGLILYEALVGTRAFDKGDDTLSMEAIVNDNLPRPEGLSDAMWGIIATALQKEPRQRFRSAAEMAELLAEAVEPMKEKELSHLLTTHFPRRVAEMGEWDKSLSKLTTTGVRGKA